MNSSHTDQDPPDDHAESPGYLVADNLINGHCGNEGAPPPSATPPTKKTRVFTKQKDCGGPPATETVEALQEQRYRGASLIKPQTMWPALGIVHDPRGQKPPSYRQGRADDAKCERENYQNDPSAYLTPTESVHYSGSFFDYPQEKANAGAVEGEQIRSQNTRVMFGRFDSGVDCATERGSSSTTFSNNPSESPRFRPTSHLEQHYEDIDTYSRDREGPRGCDTRLNGKSSMSNGSCMKGVNTRPLPKVNIARRNDPDSDDSDPILNTSIAETVSCSLNDQNLSPDQRLATLPHTYSSLNIDTPSYPAGKGASKKRSRRSSCAVFLAPIVIVFLISLAAMGLSVYVLISGRNNSETSLSSQDTHTVHQLLDDLKKQMLKLEHENAALKKQVAEQTVIFQHIEPLQSHIKSLYSQNQNLTDTLQSIKDEIAENISSIQIHPGPQGPPGIVNFSLCRNETKSSSAPTHSILPTISEYLPSEADTKRFFVTFAYCTHFGASESQLYYNVDTGQYRCDCRGLFGNFSRTTCTVHAWMCPR
ncbi:hypothetical protein Btru_059457 [Bulinus truncatus]|nr:hypothetical protein Btru_059457 [Bulinus truncatus]